MPISLFRGWALVYWAIIVIAFAQSAFAQHHGHRHHGRGLPLRGRYWSGHLSRGHDHYHWQYCLLGAHHHQYGAYYSHGESNSCAPVGGSMQLDQQLLESPQLAETEFIPSNILPPLPTNPQPPEKIPSAEQYLKLELHGLQHTEDLAARLELETNRWCLDMHYNYKHNPGFAATYREAYRLLEMAKTIHSADFTQHQDAIGLLVNKFNQSFHLLEEKMKPWTRQELRSVGDTDLDRKLELVESVLNELLLDMSSKKEHDDDPKEQAPAPARDAPWPLPVSKRM